MIVCEKAVATVNDGAGEMKGVGNAQAMSSPEFRCHVPNGGIGVNQLHAFRREEPIVRSPGRGAFLFGPIGAEGGYLRVNILPAAARAVLFDKVEDVDPRRRGLGERLNPHEDAAGG